MKIKLTYKEVNMSLSSWLLLALILWLFGYIRNVNSDSTDSNVIYVPKWVRIIICGNPDRKNKLNNTLVLGGLRSQVAGWTLAIYAIFLSNAIKDEFLSVVIGIVVCLLFSVLFTNIFTR